MQLLLSTEFFSEQIFLNKNFDDVLSSATFEYIFCSGRRRQLLRALLRMII